VIPVSTCQGVPDLLPGPALPPAAATLIRFDLFGQPPQCQHRSKANRRVF
jgi:hypothetical protein